MFSSGEQGEGHGKEGNGDDGWIMHKVSLLG